MKFDVGYFLKDEFGRPFKEIVDDHPEGIASVFFPWTSVATDRVRIDKSDGYIDWKVQGRLVSDLRYAKSHGIKLDLLFNANCYGGRSISVDFANTICSIIDYLDPETGGIDFVTTTSLFVAWVVKQRYPRIRSKASVNMRLGEPAALEPVKHLFDDFIIQRDYNRDMEHVKMLLEWGRNNDRQMRILANSGCMRLCPGQVFHDNLCSHDDELHATINVADFPVSLCGDFYSRRQNLPAMLKSTWIRPEDLHHYEGLFPSVKLATRTSLNPRRIIEAYVKQSFDGNLLELFEPNHTLLFFPVVMENKRFPKDWFERTSSCKGHCHECHYCDEVFRQIT
jgi:collagenase-like PrtC family protease